MANDGASQRLTLQLLCENRALTDQICSLAERLGVVAERAADPAQLLPESRDSAIAPCIVEARLLTERGDAAAQPAESPDNRDLILIGEAREQEALSEWLGLGNAIFLQLPLDEDYLTDLLLDIYSEQRRQHAPKQTLRPAALDQFGLLYGSSQAMRDLYRTQRKASGTDAALLLLGESGSGKELMARSVHNYSLRSDEDFESINCGAIPAELLESELFGHEKGSFSGAERRHRGLFERAGGGSVFLDEITEMPLSAQVRLLRVLETGCFRRVGGETEIPSRARIITASNRMPEEAIGQGELREDLYYRISQFEVQAPPLRERDDDVIHLARLFAQQFARQTGMAADLTPEAEAELMAFDWPGNVRQLRNTILSAARLSRGSIGPRDILEQLGSEPPAPGAVDGLGIRVGMTLADAERRLIEETLLQCGNDKSQAARTLGISVRTLYNRLNAYRDS